MIFDLLFYLFVDVLLYLPYFKSKVEKSIQNLRKESWFEKLYNDPKFNNAIWNSNKVKKFLLKSENIELVKSNDKVREEFITLIKSET
jgi:hypothetical protein